MSSTRSNGWTVHEHQIWLSNEKRRRWQVLWVGGDQVRVRSLDSGYEWTADMDLFLSHCHPQREHYAEASR